MKKVKRLGDNRLVISGSNPILLREQPSSHAVIIRHGCGGVWCIKVRVFLCRNVRVKRVILQNFSRIWYLLIIS